MLDIKLQANLWQSAIRLPNTWGKVSEAIIEAFYRTYLRPGDVALDIGGNVGRHTVPIAQSVGDEGKVFVVEPIPYIMQTLMQNHEKADVTARVQPFLGAASAAPGKATFHVASGAEALSSLSRELVVSRQQAQIEAIDVEVITVDAAYGVQPVRFMKLDVEGAEFDAMRGAAGLMRQRRPVLVFEDGRAGSARHFNYSLAEFYGFFDRLDYVVLDFFAQPVHEGHQVHPGPWNFFAVPREAREMVAELICYATFSVLLAQLQ